jgi:hypothetical protein
MIGFYKEVNREENLEIIPHADASGTFHLFFEAWLGGEGLPVVFAHWRIPNAAAAPGRNMPERGDIIRARWEIANATHLRVRASYYDASASVWFNDIINHTFDATNVSNGEAQVNYFDGYHTAASITIDSPFYSIRRFKVGTLASSPTPVSDPTASPVRNYITTNSPTLTWSSISWASGYQVEVATDIDFIQKVFTDYDLPADTLSVIVDPPLTEKRIYYWRVCALNSNSAWSQTQTFQYN